VKKIITRTITGLIFISIVIGSVCWSVYSFMLVFLAITLLCLHEYYKMPKSDTIKPQMLTSILLGVYLFLSISLYAHKVIELPLVLLNIPLASAIFIVEMYRKTERPFTNIAYTLLGVYYIALPLSLLSFFYSPFLIRGEFRTQLLLGFFIITWISETVAYLTGSAFGKHRLFERISPKKSWEGFIGQLLSGLLTAFVLSLLFKDIVLIHWIFIALIIVVIGTFGDLAESLLKRSYHEKDSGTILPGHGGLLDRFDSILFTSPFVFVYIQLFIAG